MSQENRFKAPSSKPQVLSSSSSQTTMTPQGRPEGKDEKHSKPGFEVTLDSISNKEQAIEVLTELTEKAEKELMALVSAENNQSDVEKLETYLTSTHEELCKCLRVCQGFEMESEIASKRAHALIIRAYYLASKAFNNEDFLISARTYARELDLRAGNLGWDSFIGKMISEDVAKVKEKKREVKSGPAKPKQDAKVLVRKAPKEKAKQEALTDKEQAIIDLSDLIDVADKELKLLFALTDRETVINREEFKKYFSTTHERLYQALAFCQQFDVDTNLVVQAHVLLIRAYYFANTVFDDAYFLRLALVCARNVAKDLNIQALTPMDNYMIAQTIFGVAKAFPGNEQGVVFELLPEPLLEIMQAHLHAAKNPNHMLLALQPNYDETLYARYALLAGQKWNNLYKPDEKASMKNEGNLKQKFGELIRKIEVIENKVQGKVRGSLKNVLGKLEDKYNYYNIISLIETVANDISQVAKDLEKETRESKENKNTAEALKYVNELNNISQEFRNLEVSQGKLDAGSVLHYTSKPEDQKNEIIKAPALQEKQKEEALEKSRQKAIKCAHEIAKFHQEMANKIWEIYKDVKELQSDIISMHAKPMPNTIFSRSPASFLLSSPEEFSKNIQEVREAAIQLREFNTLTLAYIQGLGLTISVMNRFGVFYQKVQRQQYALEKFSQEQLVAMSSSLGSVREMYFKHIDRVNQLMRVYDDAELQCKAMQSHVRSIFIWEQSASDTDKGMPHRTFADIPELLFGLNKKLTELSPEKFEGCESVLKEIHKLKKIFKEKIDFVNAYTKSKEIVHHLVEIEKSLDVLLQKIGRAQDMWKAPDFTSPEKTAEERKELVKKLLSEYENVKSESKTEIALYEFMREKIQDPHVASDILRGLTELANQALDEFMKEQDVFYSGERPLKIQEYLKTTHEALHQCLCVSEKFQKTKEGKSTHAINAKYIGYAHAALARGYHVAGYFSQDELFLQQLSQYERAHQEKLEMPNLYSPVDNYLVAMRIIQDAKDSERKLTNKEKHTVHKYLNAAIKPEKRTKGLNDSYGGEANVALREFLGATTDRMPYEPSEQKIAELYKNDVNDKKSENIAPVENIKSYRDNEARRMNEIYEGLREILRALDSLPKDRRNTLRNILMSQKIPEVIFMCSPAKILLSMDRHLSVTKTAQALRKFREAIFPCIIQLECYDRRISNEERNTLIKQLKLLDRNMRERAYYFENYSKWFNGKTIAGAEFEYFDDESQMGFAKKDSEKCVDFEAYWQEKIETLLDEAAECFYKEGHNGFDEEAFDLLVNHFGYLHKNIGNLFSEKPKDTQEILKEVDKLSVGIKRYIKTYDSFFSSAMNKKVCEYFKKLDLELQTLKGKIGEIASVDMVAETKKTPGRESDGVVESKTARHEKDEKQSAAPKQSGADTEKAYQALKETVERADQELISVLSVKNGKLSINKEALEKYLNTTQNELSRCLEINKTNVKDERIERSVNYGHVLRVRADYLASKVFINHAFLVSAQGRARDENLRVYSAMDHYIFAEVILGDLKNSQGNDDPARREGLNKLVYAHLRAAKDVAPTPEMPDEIHEYYASRASDQLDQEIDLCLPEIKYSGSSENSRKLSELQEKILQLRKDIPSACFAALPKGPSDFPEFLENIKKVGGFISQLRELRAAINEYTQIIEASPRLTKPEEEFLGQMKKLNKEVQRQLYCWGKYSKKQLVDKLDQKINSVADAQKMLYQHIDGVMQLMSVYDYMQLKFQEVADIWGSAKAYIVQNAPRAKDNKGLFKCVQDALNSLDEHLSGISPEKFDGCEMVLFKIRRVKGTLETNKKTAIKYIGSGIENYFDLMIGLLDDWMVKIEGENRIQGIQGMWKAPAFRPPKRTPEECREKAGWAIEQCQEAKRAPSKLIRESMRDPLSGSEILTGLVEIAKEALRPFADGSVAERKELEKYLNATHEALYQCLMICEEFQTKNGKKTYAIDDSLMRSAYEELDRGYKIASRAFNDERFLQYVKFDEKTSEKTMTPDAHFYVNNNKRIREINEDMRKFWQGGLAVPQVKGRLEAFREIFLHEIPEVVFEWSPAKYLLLDAKSHFSNIKKATEGLKKRRKDIMDYIEKWHKKPGELEKELIKKLEIVNNKIREYVYCLEQYSDVSDLKKEPNGEIEHSAYLGHIKKVQVLEARYHDVENQWQKIDAVLDKVEEDLRARGVGLGDVLSLGLKKHEENQWLADIKSSLRELYEKIGGLPGNQEVVLADLRKVMRAVQVHIVDLSEFSEGMARIYHELEALKNHFKKVVFEEAANQTLNDLIGVADLKFESLLSLKDGKLAKIDEEKLKEYLRTVHGSLYRQLYIFQELQKERERMGLSPNVELNENLVKANALCIRAYCIAYMTFKDEIYLTLARSHVGKINLHSEWLEPIDNYFIGEMILGAIEESPDDGLVHIQEMAANHYRAAMRVTDKSSNVNKLFSGWSKNQLELSAFKVEGQEKDREEKSDTSKINSDLIEFNRDDLVRVESIENDIYEIRLLMYEVCGLNPRLIQPRRSDLSPTALLLSTPEEFLKVIGNARDVARQLDALKADVLKRARMIDGLPRGVYKDEAMKAQLVDRLENLYVKLHRQRYICKMFSDKNREGQISELLRAPDASSNAQEIYWHHIKHVNEMVSFYDATLASEVRKDFEKAKGGVPAVSTKTASEEPEKEEIKERKGVPKIIERREDDFLMKEYEEEDSSSSSSTTTTPATPGRFVQPAKVPETIFGRLAQAVGMSDKPAPTPNGPAKQVASINQ